MGPRPYQPLPLRGPWLTVNFGYLIHLVLPNPVIVIADLRPFSKLIGFFVAFFWREFIYMIDWGWLSHIPLLFYVLTNLNCVYFNFNFCIENWQQTISFLKLESNLMINAVSVKKARKLFCTSFGNARSLNPFGMICRFSCPHKFL